MKPALNKRLRQLWLDIHLWIGVGLTLALVPLAVSGALLVWHDPIQEAMQAHRYDVSESRAVLSPSVYKLAADEAFGDRAMTQDITFPDEAGQPVIATGRMEGAPDGRGRLPQLTAWIDPATAEVKDVANTRQAIFSILHRFHGTLMIPDIGRKVVGWLGWAMTISCLTGLWLWWPRAGGVAKGFRWRRTPMVMDNLHHLLGFWILVPLLVVSLTGVYISFPTSARTMFGIEQSGPPRSRPAPTPPAPAPLEATTIDIDAAANAVLAASPGATIAEVGLPRDGAEPEWTFELSSGESAIVADAPASIAVINAAPEQAAPTPRRRADPISGWMRQVHYGTGTGLIWQTLLFLSGIIPAVLSVTGIVMWLRKRARKAALARLAQQDPKAAPAE